MDGSTLESVGKFVERIGFPAALVLVGLYILRSVALGIVPPFAAFLNGLTSKLDSHTTEHAKIEGKIEAHHERTVAAVQLAAAEIKSTVDSARGSVVAAVDAAADRTLDAVRDESRVFTRAPSDTPVSGTMATRKAGHRIVVDGTESTAVSEGPNHGA